MSRSPPVPVEHIERAILILRGHKVMLDTDLAALYGIETRVLVQAVKRNLERFPRDFMFQKTSYLENVKDAAHDRNIERINRMYGIV
jgi:hypothetical protein